VFTTDEPHDITIARVVDLAFGGDRARYDSFIAELKAVTPEDASVILRGSAVTGTRWADGAPFDSDGKGSSDLDVTFVGGGMIHHWDEFYIPGLHTVPLSEEHPDACPELTPLRATLCRIAGRPVNIQATTGLVQFARDVTFDQPWVELIENREKAREEAAKAAASEAEAAKK
jgi:hypothetical protein